MSTLAVFPGQGSQKVGMGKELLNDFPIAKHVFEEAEDASRVQIRNLCLEGPSEKLQLTEFQQPCILTVSTAIWRICQSEADLSANYFAGHSLGEYSALVASNRLPFSEAVSMVHTRGKAMQEATPLNTGAMAAIMGGTTDTILTTCEETKHENGEVAEVVNFNAPGQHILSGHKNAVSKVCDILKKKLGLKAIPLPVSAPFHSSLMVAAREKMAPIIENANFSEGQGSMISNLTGKLEASYDPGLLVRQIDSPVLWSQSLQTAAEAGIKTCIEIGAGKVLSNLARKNFSKEIQIISTDSIKAALEQIEKL